MDGIGMDGIGSPGGRGYRAPYGANNIKNNQKNTLASHFAEEWLKFC